MRKFLKTSLVAAFMAFSFISAQAAELLMFEHVGCVVCKRFKAEMLPKYLKSKFAKVMPIRSIVGDDPDPYKGLTDLKGFPFIHSPTFVLVENGRELARIRGFAGEKLFWAQMENLLANHKHKFNS